MWRFLLCALALAILPTPCSAQESALTLTVGVDEPGARISPTMWGGMIEDMSFAVDGGLYAELVKNRSFEFPDPLMGWTKTASSGNAEILDRDPFSEAQPHYLRLEHGAGVSNEGFRGIGVREKETYIFSVQVRAAKSHPVLYVQLVGSGGRSLAEARLSRIPRRWTRYTATLRTTATDAKARLNLTVEGAGAADVDMVSLFPQKTWRNRPGGLRADLAQMIADLKPGFIKFPGGFSTEGRDLESHYQWKSTIGDITERRLAISPWNKFSARPMPDYYQSLGFGFFEYFQLSEDLGAEPLPVLNPGMAAMFSGKIAPMDQLAPYVQDALDLVEFANDPPTSAWGGMRARMGHPAPFHLKMLRIGNEQTGPGYFERYRQFATAMAAKHPEIKLIGGTGPRPDGADFDLAWENLLAAKADIVDEHSHNQPDWFYGGVTHFDRVSRDGPKVMMGEWAAHTEPGLVNSNNRNNLAAALAEAAFMTGLERNADLVVMSAYAPLLANADAWQWKPSLIWFDSLQTYGTPSYYVQKLFGENRGDVVLPVQLQGGATQRRFYASAARDERSGEIIIKAVNPLSHPVTARIKLAGAHIGLRAQAMILTGAAPTDENSFEQPRKVYPVQEPLAVAGSEFDYTFRPYALTVLRLSDETR